MPISIEIAAAACHRATKDWSHEAERANYFGMEAKEQLCPLDLLPLL